MHTRRLGPVLLMSGVALLAAASGPGPGASAAVGIERFGPAVNADTDLAPALVYLRTFTPNETLAAPWVTLEGVGLEPGGNTGLVLAGSTGGRVSVSSEFSLPFALASRLVLNLRARGPGATRVEVELFDDSVGTRRWHEIEVDDRGSIEIPLVHFRHDRGRVPDLRRTTRWGLRFVDPGVIEIESFELWRDDDRTAEDRELDDLIATFPEPDRVRVFRRAPFVLVTDAETLAPAPVLDALERSYVHTRQLLPSMPVPSSSVPLLVFAEDAGYRGFWSRYSAARGAAVEPLREDDGFTWQGVATASFSRAYGEVRPTYVHEAHHALMERAWGLAAQRSWLFESLANVEQLAISRQDIRLVYRTGLRRGGQWTPIAELGSGAPIATKNYWQATLLMQWLVADATRRRALDSAVVEMAQLGSSDLRPLARRHFGRDIDALAVELWWWAWDEYSL